MPPGYSAADFYFLMPQLVLTAGILLVLALDVLLPRRLDWIALWASVAVVAVTALTLLPLRGIAIVVSHGLVAVDGFAVFFHVIFLTGAALTLLLSRPYLATEQIRAGTYAFLVLCATLGMMMMASAIELVTLFIGLETMAVSFYVLVGFLKSNRRSNEAAVKYFVLGAFSLAILLYGMSLLYALAGTTYLRDLAVILATAERSGAVKLAILLVAAGIGFKIAAVPFHMWAPDVYEGAPTPVAAFLSVGSKAAAFAMLLRIMLEGLPALGARWVPVLYVMAVLTMTVGNVAALTQGNVKRLLAYSSIAHAGYILIGVVAATPRGVAATLLYLFVYAFAQIGAFGVVMLLRHGESQGDELRDLGGLYYRSPAAAFAMLLFVLSLGGIPPTAGFMGKLWIFSAAIESGYLWLAVIGVLNSALSLYYYVRIVVFMWMRPPAEQAPLASSPGVVVALAAAAVLTLAIGLYPASLFTVVEASARALGAVPVPALTTW